MVPGGGANAEGWTAFRDALARIEAYTSQAGPTQVQPLYEPCISKLAWESMRYSPACMAQTRIGDRCDAAGSM